MTKAYARTGIPSILALTTALSQSVAAEPDKAQELTRRLAIAQTDLILTVPHRLAKLIAVMAGVRVVEAPREIKSFPHFMAWHPRLTNEPAHKWFHEQLRSAVRIV